MEYCEDFSDLMVVLDWMSQRKVRPNAVVVAAAIAMTLQVAGRDQLAHDPLGGSFGDPYPDGKVAHTNARIPGDAPQNVGVVGEERPYGHLPILAHTR